MKRVILVHGWGGTPNDGWFPWLTHELKAHGYEVVAPQFPDPWHPRVGAWGSTLADAVGTPDRETFFVGYSIGCQTIARYLETLPEGDAVGGAVFVAGFFRQLKRKRVDPETAETDAHWQGNPVNLALVRTRVTESVAIFSDTDPFVSLDNQEDFRDGLGSKIVIEHQKGHFTLNRDGVVELPSVLQYLLAMGT